MNDRKQGTAIAVRVLAALAMLINTLAGAAPSVTAQGSVDVAIYTQENGQAAYDACYILVGYSDVGCDENGDGKVTFADIPFGTYTVQQTANLGSGRSVSDFTITVTGNVNSEGYEGFTATIVGGSGSSAGSGASGYSDIAIVTTENGQPAYDACYVIVDYSEVGCDENGDGKITFEDIPLGAHTVRQTADLGPGRSVNDFTINVTGAASADGWERFSATIVGGSGGASTTSDVAIVTTENGQPVYDACYAIVDYSEVGCDENRDGKITFEDIPFGTWTVRQTADLGPGRSVAEFTIQVTGAASGDGWERFPAAIVSTGGSSAASAQDISLITRDPDTGGLLTGACYVLVDYSEEGCDENGDGQVTFDDMPPGTYTVHQTQAPAGYPTINDFPVTIDGTFPNVPAGYLVRQAPEQNAPGTRNVSVVFIDSRTHTKIVPSPICLQIGTVSEVGCDDDLPDGQIDFLDVQTGAHEIAFSNLPADWQVLGGVGPYTVNIVAGPGPQVVYMQVLTGSGSSGASTGTGSGSGSIPTGSGAIAVVGGGQTGTESTGAPSTGTASAGPAVELILDTSGSMNERDQGSQTRLEVAKTVTTRLVTETLPAGVPMALRTYSGCSSSLAIPMQPLDPNAASGAIANLRASGSTPIAQSLRAASSDLDNVPGPKMIVLVTDGEETCGGDPRSAIEALVAQNVDIQVNIVGFAIDDATLTATFQEWARVGNGTYFEASDEIELDQAVTTASQLPFRVLDQQGTVIANGVVGGAPVAVPAGTYVVEIDTAPVTRHENVVVTAGGTTTIDLGTGGTTSSGGGAMSGSQDGNAQVIVPDGSQGGAAQVSDPDGSQSGSAQAIVPDDGVQGSAGTAQQTSNVVISTVISGYPFHDACYVLVGYSDVACAEPPDYVVRFHDVPLGTYTVRQTADLGPGRWVDDFTIHVTGSGDWEGFQANVDMADSSSSTPTGKTFGGAIVTRDNDQIIDAA
jgi:hypothetical protein